MGFPVVQQGLLVGYRLEDIQALEKREVLAVLQQVLAADRPLPLTRAIIAAVMSQPASAESVTPAVVLHRLPGTHLVHHDVVPDLHQAASRSRCADQPVSPGL